MGTPGILNKRYRKWMGTLGVIGDCLYEVMVVYRDPRGSLKKVCGSSTRAKRDFLSWIDFFFIVHSSKKSFWGRLCSKRNTFSRVAGAWRVRSRIFLHELIYFVKTVNLFLWSVALKSRFNAAYVVSVTLFRALRAPGACKAGFFFIDWSYLSRQLLYSNCL